MRRYILKIEYDVGNGPMVRESVFYYDESKEDEIQEAIGKIYVNVFGKTASFVKMTREALYFNNDNVNYLHISYKMS